MTPKIYIKKKRSKKTGKLYWTMTGGNGEKMGHSQGIENATYFKNLMKRFAAMGFIIID